MGLIYCFSVFVYFIYLLLMCIFYTYLGVLVYDFFIENNCIYDHSRNSDTSTSRLRIAIL